MSGLHAAYSAGALSGALGSALAASTADGLLPDFALVAAVLAVAGLAGSRGMLGPEADRTPPSPPPSGPAGDNRARGRRVLWAAGIIACCSLSVEGAADNWSSALAGAGGRASLAVAALAPAAANCGMLLGRLGGDAAVRRFGSQAVLVAAVLLVAAAQCAAGLAGWAPVIIAGYAVLGAGCGPVVPIAYATAGAAPGLLPARSIAQVTAMGYAGQIACPVVIGAAAGGMPLAAALALPAVVLLCAALLAAPVFGPPRSRIGQPSSRGRRFRSQTRLGSAAAPRRRNGVTLSP
jgi:hypothetical protein